MKLALAAPLAARRRCAITAINSSAGDFSCRSGMDRGSRRCEIRGLAAPGQSMCAGGHRETGSFSNPRSCDRGRHRDRNSRFTTPRISLRLRAVMSPRGPHDFFPRTARQVLTRRLARTKAPGGRRRDCRNLDGGAVACEARSLDDDPDAAGAATPALAPAAAACPVRRGCGRCRRRCAASIRPGSSRNRHWRNTETYRRWAGGAMRGGSFPEGWAVQAVLRLACARVAEALWSPLQGRISAALGGRRVDRRHRGIRRDEPQPPVAALAAAGARGRGRRDCQPPAGPARERRRPAAGTGRCRTRPGATRAAVAPTAAHNGRSRRAN